MSKYKKIPIETSIHLRYLHQDKGETLEQLLRRYPQYSRTSIFRHSKRKIGDDFKDRRHENKGRKPLLDERDSRKIVKSLHKLRETHGNFYSTDIQKDCGLTENKASNRTIRRKLRKLGYTYDQCRKKGQLLEDDLKKRLKFARQCNKLPETFWQEGISFYLDGTGWVHKTNPSGHARTDRTRIWKLKGESLRRHCTAKGKKEGVGGKMAKFMVAIAYQKGVIKCHQYEGAINAETCKSFIDENFPDMFEKSGNTKGKLFLQDGDPSQNSKLAKDAMDSIGCRLFKIPPRSPDLNPIENIFHLIGKQLKKDALKNNLQRESYAQFCDRVKRTVLAYPADVIDKTISSMPKRIAKILKVKGHRTKY